MHDSPDINSFPNVLGESTSVYKCNNDNLYRQAGKVLHVACEDHLIIDMLLLFLKIYHNII